MGRRQPSFLIPHFCHFPFLLVDTSGCYVYHKICIVRTDFVFIFDIFKITLKCYKKLSIIIKNLFFYFPGFNSSPWLHSYHYGSAWKVEELQKPYNLIPTHQFSMRAASLETNLRRLFKDKVKSLWEYFSNKISSISFSNKQPRNTASFYPMIKTTVKEYG